LFVLWFVSFYSGLNGLNYISGIKHTINVPLYYIVSVWVGIGKLHLMNKCACIIHSLDTLLHAVSKWQTGESVKLTTL